MRLRWIWLFRAVFYGGAVLLLMLKLTGAFDPAEANNDPGGRLLNGETSQGHKIEMYVVDGRAYSFDLRIDYTCGYDLPFPTRWNPADTGRIPFEQAGDDLLVTERFGAFVWTLHGRVDDSKASGTARVVASFDSAHGRSTRCDSGDVRWSIKR